MLLPGPLRNMMRPRGGQPPGGGNNAGPRDGADSIRASRGLEEFCNEIRDQIGLSILDLGGASQQNVNFITNLGHRLYSEDFLRLLQECFDGEDPASQSNPGRIDFFLKQAIDYPEHHFDGVLMWDVLEYLSPALLASVMERLLKVVRPKGYMLGFFHADDKMDAVPFYAFRIQDVRTLQVSQTSVRKPAQLFNNRSLEKLFAKAESVKFFLTKDRLREVVVKV